MTILEFHLDRTMAPNEDDFLIIRRITAGDSTALRELYIAYGQRMYAYAYRLTNDPALAEDVLQESLVAAWKGASRFRFKGRVISWLLGIVHHQALNVLRKKTASSIDELEQDLPDQQLPLDEQAALFEQRRIIQAGLARLSLDQRMVLELVFYQGLSMNEAAEVCRCPVGTVKSRLNHAKASLRGILTRAGLRVEDIQ